MSSNLLEKMRGERVSVRQLECAAGHFAAARTVRRFALWVTELSIFQKRCLQQWSFMLHLAGVLFVHQRHSVLSASHQLLRNCSFLWSSSSHITNPAILHLQCMLRLQIRAGSLVYRQFYQLEVLWAWIKIQMDVWRKLIVKSPT